MVQDNAHPEHSGPGTRRDILYYATGGTAAVATGAVVWPLIDSMNPSADVSALSVVQVDLEGVEPGSRITLKWKGKPVFIDHRTEVRIAQARADDAETLIDPELDAERVQKPEWLIVVGVCTHLGCIPLGQGSGDPTGGYGGWFCPCHGSHYDTSGRIRKGPAPRNLDVPTYEFVTDTLVKIG
ncbi:ubiquinol-cytochrome c reductase iron-sulfur subunit [Leisingera sp. HS039]|uniref:ubiquinol-cytochrome c reductase iron-sulfur subunit n=1 Tax=unclassified Leisingera TaxID=2614906 RepID=UPI00198047F9|nr:MULTISPECIES: ubiquinol-cytochrome c reductase iron-sulfur subunit [unclassified Leisingera]MBQ4823834.1 ubiquinol-cytochrome c reductase iron-sulfur subunit [Leisingera sp. HS039]